MKKKICLVIFIVLFVVSILVNVKLLFFSPAVSLKNIPFEGVITEADSGIENGYFSAIDAEPFVDPVDNQKYLLFTHDKGAGYTSSSTYIMKKRNLR